MQKLTDSTCGTGGRIIVPEIADYEVRRELIRAGKSHGIARLDALGATFEYLTLSTEVTRLAACLWAELRTSGMATADARA